ncbi:MAG: glycosyltransferase family 2 protein [Ruminococcaceae bacterium]|nr:glycosyltransferase family 2 protein [Oscillospiraceae bacterium]
MKKISIMVPCYNEEENVVPMSEALVAELEKLPQYDYEILFIDNCSLDTTREKLREICAKNSKIKAIFNSKNFGQFNSPYHGLCQTTGDCTISVCCDFQDPVDMIPKFIAEWEKGAKIVCGIKTSSKESKVMYFLRSVYYKAIKKLSKVEQIEHFTGFGLYDKSFIDVLRNLGDPTPFIRGIVAELGPKVVKLEYEQAQRRAGKTSNNFFSLYDAAMLSFTSYTKIGARFASFLGMFMCGTSALAAVISLIVKIIRSAVAYEPFTIGIGAAVLSTFFVGGLILFFVGLLGEYIIGMNARIMNRPLVIEEERINFDK